MSPVALGRVALRVGILAVSSLAAGCMDDLRQLFPERLDTDQTAPAAATDLGWAQTSPTPMASLTATWTASTSDDVAGQEIQVFADAACGNPHGGPVSIPSAVIVSYNFTGNDLASYSYRVTSIDGAGNRAVSDCSPAISVTLTSAPSVTLSGPSATPVRATAEATYTVNYDRAASVTLDSATPVSLQTTGSANCDVTVSGSGNVGRTIQLRNCTGDGTVAIEIAPGTSSNLAGSDVGAGPSNAVIVDNTAPVPATNPGWLQASPSAVTSVTASWTVSADSDLASQAIQFHAAADCNAAVGPPLDLGSTTISTHNITGNDSATYWFAITSGDQAGNQATSQCSPAMTIHTSGAPTLALSSPSVSRVSAAGTASFALVYTNADSINVSLAAIGQVVTGDARCQLALRGVGATTRFVDLTNCVGDGSVSIQVAGGTASNLSGPAGGAGPSTPVTVDNTAPADAEGLGWSANSPTPSVPITATWTPSLDANLTDQTLQLYADGQCGTPDGAALSFGSALTASADLPAMDGGTYSYRITSRDDLGLTSVSACSIPLTVSLVGGPSINVESSGLSAGGSTSYQVSGGTDPLTVWVAGAGSVTNASGDGIYSAPTQCTGGADTLYVSDALGYSAGVTVNYAGDASYCDSLQISVANTDLSAGSSTSYSVSGGSGSYSVSADNGWVDNGGGDGNYYAPSGCDGGTATLTVTDSNGTMATVQVNYAGDGSQCGPQPVYVSVDSSYITGDGGTAYYVSGGSGSYSVSVQNLWGSGPVGAIDNGSGSGTYYISPGDCDSGNSGTDQIDVSDSNGTSASVQISWTAATCDTGPSISVGSTELGAGGSTYYDISGGTGSYSVNVDSGSVDNGSGSGNYYAPYGCDGGTATLTVTDSNGASATVQVNYAGDGSQCGPPPVSISVDSSAITGDGSTAYYVSGGSGSYSVSVQNLGGSGPTGWIDNGGGSGTYYISPGACDSGNSGTDQIDVSDSNGTSASVQISWGAATCDPVLAISVASTDIGPGSSTSYSVAGGSGSYSITVDYGWVDNGAGDGNYNAPYGCDGGTATLTVTDTNGATATVQVNYAGDGSQCSAPW